MAAPELKQQKSLIRGLPDHLVLDEILPRAPSWWDCRSIRAVSKGWRGAVEDSNSRAPKNMFAAIHRDSESPDHLTLAVSVYDPQLRMWEKMPPIPGLPCGAPLSARCICVDGGLFVLGGRVFPSLEFLDQVFFMDLRSCKRRWIECGSKMNQARSGFACMAWKGKIIVAGGQGDEEIAMSSVEAYDPERDCWSDLPDLEIPRAECTGAVIENGILCVIGGYTIHPFDDQQTVWVNSMDVLEIGRRGGWETVESSSSSKGVLRSCVISSGALNRLQRSAFERILRRCEADWMILEGKICAAERKEQIPDCLVLMTIGEGGEEYVARCKLDARTGNVSTSLCQATTVMNPNKNQSAWEEIELPFELLPTVSCCSITV